MRWIYSRFIKALPIPVIIAALAIIGACSVAPANTPATTPAAPAAVTYDIKTASKAGVGDYLVDSRGMALYYFTKDAVGKSNASAAVLQLWPIFNVANPVIQPSLNAADFATSTRADGAQQMTYKGWPLYYYVKDQSPGDTLGEAVGGVWYLIKVPFYNIMLQTKADLGTYLVDAKGMTLYYFTKDNLGKSNATSAIIQNWPVFNTGNFIVPSLLNVADFSTITRDDGLKQTTYKGWPLYYYVKDRASGDTLGQGINGVWFIVNPDKLPAATAGVPVSTSPVSPQSSSFSY